MDHWHTSHADHMHITQSLCVYTMLSILHLFRPDKSGRLYVSYEVIGRNMVSVPTHFFKVIAYQDVHSPKLSVEVGQVIFANSAQYHMCGVVLLDHHHQQTSICEQELSQYSTQLKDQTFDPSHLFNWLNWPAICSPLSLSP